MLCCTLFLLCASRSLGAAWANDQPLDPKNVVSFKTFDETNNDNSTSIDTGNVNSLEEYVVDDESGCMLTEDNNEQPNLEEEQSEEDLLFGKRNHQYMLYTSQNPEQHQLLIYGDANSVSISNYRPEKPLNMIVHGWLADGTSELNPKIKDAFLAVSDCNVIVLDWSDLSIDFNINKVVPKVPIVGHHLGLFLVWLIESFGGNWNNVHLVGHSLGAHIVGIAGRASGRRVARITGLDPAGFGFSPLNDNRIHGQDGQYVEIIHTDSGTLTLGSQSPIPNAANFYPHGGIRHQPGCEPLSFPGCSHSRSHDYFAASVRYNNFVARQCIDIEKANRVDCWGPQAYMGNAKMDKRVRFGLYALTIRDTDY